MKKENKKQVIRCCIFGAIGGGGRGAMGAENVRLIGNAEGIELLTGTLDNGPVRIASHNNCYFFHEILLVKSK